VIELCLLKRIGGESMKEQTVDIRQSTGRILCTTIFRPGGRKLLAKGHVLSQEDVRLLETEGLQHVEVTELEQGEVGEDEAVCQTARELGCGCLEIRLAAGGRANLYATEDSCVLIDEELLKQINCISSVVIATEKNFRMARSCDRIATVKSSPFAVPGAELETIINMLRERGPILQARPIRSPSIAVPSRCSKGSCANVWRDSALLRHLSSRRTKRSLSWPGVWNISCARNPRWFSSPPPPRRRVLTTQSGAR